MMATQPCPNCGAPVPAGAVFCMMCGTRLAPPPAANAKADAPASFPAKEVAQAAIAAAPAPAQTAPPPTVAPEVPADWLRYEDHWNGYSLAHPQGWHVLNVGDRILVHEGPTLFCAAVLWPLHMQAAVPVAQVAQQFVALARQSDPQMQAWQGQEASPDPNRMMIRTSSLTQGTQVDGAYTVMTEGANALLSGFICPPQIAQQRAPIMARILASYRPVEVLPKQPVQEQTEGAYTAQIPAGWTFTGSVNRNNAGGAGAIQFTAARDGQGLVSAALPAMQWTFSEGSNMFGGGQALQFMPATELCRQVVPQWMSQYNADLHIENIEDRPDITLGMTGDLINAGIPQGSFDTSAATITTTYTEAGQRLMQKAQVSVFRMRQAQAMFAMPSMWLARLDSLYRAPVAEFANWEPVLIGILQSVRLTQAWQGGEQQLAQNYQMNAFQDQQRRIGQISQTISETNDILTQGYWNRQAVQDQTFRSMDNVIRGTQDMVSDTGQTYNVPAGFDRYWVDNLNTLHTGTWATNPDINWHPLEPTGT